jgi:hypothetical protein
MDIRPLAVDICPFFVASVSDLKPHIASAGADVLQHTPACQTASRECYATAAESASALGLGGGLPVSWLQ